MQSVIADIGNSTVCVAEWIAEERRDEPARERRLQRIFTDASPSDEAACARLAARLAGCVAAAGDGSLILASVVPVADAAIAAAVPSVFRIDHTLDFPFRLEVANPETVGADRFCNIAAAHDRGWPDALIVDAGTATTFDLLRDGGFAGGLIAPGMAFAAQKLGEAAARLQPVEFAPVALQVGTDTASAMRVGSYYAGIHGVNGTIAALLERYGKMPVVLTGGLGRFLQTPAWPYDADWTLKGAACLAKSII